MNAIKKLFYVAVAMLAVLPANAAENERAEASDASIVLHEVVVKGVFSKQSRAINTQKENINVTNIVSADQIGKFPDSNIGDAIKRISGNNCTPT